MPRYQAAHSFNKRNANNMHWGLSIALAKVGLYLGPKDRFLANDSHRLLATATAC